MTVSFKTETTLAKTESEADILNIWFRDRDRLRDLHSALKFYPQKLQKLFCANMLLFVIRAAPADKLTLCQTFRYNLFRLRKVKNALFMQAEQLNH